MTATALGDALRAQAAALVALADVIDRAGEAPRAGASPVALVTRAQLRDALAIGDDVLRRLERQGLPAVQVSPGARGRRYDVAAVMAALAAPKPPTPPPPTPPLSDARARALGVVPLSRPKK